MSTYHPYTLPSGTRLQFADIGEVLKQCVSEETDVGEDGKERPILDLQVILPGNALHTGYPTDGLYLHKVIRSLSKLCSSLDLRLTRRPSECASWECDLDSLKVSQRRLTPDAKRLRYLREISKMIPELAQESGEDDDAWIERCLKIMDDRQKEMRTDAEASLGAKNLLIVGSTNVNQVHAMLMHRYFREPEILGELGVFSVPQSGQLPMTLSRAWGRNQWDEWRHDCWEDNRIGWLQMVRNPWAVACSPPSVCL